ncbi:MAG: HNH endonuclease [Terracoccus sp.]
MHDQQERTQTDGSGIDAVLAFRAIARFETKYYIASSGCWIWKGRISDKGYAEFALGGNKRAAHRVSWVIFKGNILAGAQLDHLCRVRYCVNPDHLDPVDARTNLLRGMTLAAANASKTHCPQGHPYDEANTHRKLGGNSRACRACNRADCAQRRARQKAQA